MSISPIAGYGGSDFGYLSQTKNSANRISRTGLENAGTEGCKT
jgi:hypothetical protein